MSEELPPCGLYRTSKSIGGVPEDRLVYFHNHGDPGPGIYLPEAWKNNRARFSAQGTTLDDLDLAQTLEPVAAEGLYRVVERFYCCTKQCRDYDSDTLVQLGYNARAEPILFLPALSDNGVTLPERGQRIDSDGIARLKILLVETAQHRSRTTSQGSVPLH